MNSKNIKQKYKVQAIDSFKSFLERNKPLWLFQKIIKIENEKFHDYFSFL